jgi:hypothetical protein
MSGASKSILRCFEIRHLCSRQHSLRGSQTWTLFFYEPFLSCSMVTNFTEPTGRNSRKAKQWWSLAPDHNIPVSSQNSASHSSHLYRRWNSFHYPLDRRLEGPQSLFGLNGSKCMKQSPWEDKSSLRSEDILPPRLWGLKTHHRVHKSPLLDPVWTCWRGEVGLSMLLPGTKYCLSSS